MSSLRLGVDNSNANDHGEHGSAYRVLTGQGLASVEGHSSRLQSYFLYVCHFSVMSTGNLETSAEADGV